MVRLEMYMNRNLTNVYFPTYRYDCIKKMKSVSYSSQGSHTDQLDFCNKQADGSTMG